jgi:outer membrane protein
MRMRRGAGWWIGPVAAPAVGVLVASCAPSPFTRPISEPDLRRSAVEAVERELTDAGRHPEAVVVSRQDTVALLGIKPEFMDELNRMGGPGSYVLDGIPLNPDLSGQPARTLRVSLERAVRTALERNIAVQFARLAPAVSETQVLAAEAAFDWSFFANGTWNNTDSPAVSTAFSGSTSPVRSNQVESLTGNLGWRRTLVGGGRLTIQHDLGYSDVNTPGQSNVPNPAESAALTVQWDQPLLRNSGSDVTRAEIRINRNAERSAVQSLRRDMIRVLTDTERTYWDLVRATYDVMILERLLHRGEQVKAQLESRANIDANQVHIARARARIEQRRADLRRAQTQLRLVGDRLKALMNDPGVPVGSEVVLLPADMAPDQPVRFSLLESLRQAVTYRPEVQQAVIAIDDASIRQVVARSARLPDLSLRLQARWAQLDNTIGESYAGLFDGQFIDYLVGFTFEQPIGNRRAEAQYLQRRLERTQTVLAYRNSVQQTANEVKSALIRVKLNYDLIGQARSSRVAAAEELRVLLVEKERLQGFTVERLDLELRDHEQLAAQEQQEIQSLVEYNQAIAELFQAIGTTLERNNVSVVVPGAGESLRDRADVAP